MFRQILTTDDQDFYGFDVDINVDIRIGQDEPQWDLVAGAHQGGTDCLFAHYSGRRWQPRPRYLAGNISGG